MTMSSRTMPTACLQRSRHKQRPYHGQRSTGTPHTSPVSDTSTTRRNPITGERSSGSHQIRCSMPPALLIHLGLKAVRHARLRPSSGTLQTEHGIPAAPQLQAVRASPRPSGMLLTYPTATVAACADDHEARRPSYLISWNPSGPDGTALPLVCRQNSNLGMGRRYAYARKLRAFKLMLGFRDLQSQRYQLHHGSF